MKKILVIGSWAKEQITIQNIKKDSSYRVFSYLDTPNPKIISLADGYFLGNISDVKSILNYAKKIKPDLTLITTAAPLACGVSDELIKEGWRVFGPRRLSAQLESNKVFARNLMKKYLPESLPEFRVFESGKKAVSYAAENDFQVAVKPIGLTEGLGVKVFGDQLKSKEEISHYINQILKGGKNKKVIVEEKIQGQEFTLQCFVGNKIILPTPCVQDFKKLLPGDKGPNTASMGSYSAAGNLLPFMRQSDYDLAFEIMRETIFAFENETGQKPCGFLYGQFMITKSGIKLIEYNFRPGDPEWINTVFILKDNIAEVAEHILAGKRKDLKFEKKATVCKYITPENYPYRLNQTLKVDFSPAEAKKEGVGVYYSCGQGKEGQLEVGSERGIAFVGADKAIPDAAARVESVIAKVKGDFFYRQDIGKSEQIKRKIKETKKIRPENEN